jgi:nicotinamidase-related amidase
LNTSGQVEGTSSPKFGLLVVDALDDAIQAEAAFDDMGDSVIARTAFRKRLNELVVPNVERLVEAIRLRREPVVWITSLPRAEAIAAQSTFPPGSAPTDADYVLRRTGPSAFWSAQLDAILRNRGVTHVLVTGAYTNEGVLVHAVDASHRGYFPTMVDDASAARSEREHELGLRAVHLQHDVADTNEVLARLREPQEVSK